MKTKTKRGPDDDMTKWGAEGLANARLIAAAPDLLEALNRALDLIEDIPQSALNVARIGSGYIGSVKDQARAAIAKAEGK